MKPFVFAASVMALIMAQGVNAQTSKIPVEAKFDVSSMPVKIHNSLPAMCDTYVRNAANTLNAAGAKFQLTGAASNYGNEWVNDDNTDPDFVNVLPGAMGYGGSVTAMQTNSYYSWFPGMPWEDYYEKIDANVYVNSDLIYYPGTTDTQKGYDFTCTTATSGLGSKVDFETALLHEFGHVAGLGHRTDGATGPCVMAANYQRGTVKRRFCADEIAKLKEVYGAR